MSTRAVIARPTEGHGWEGRYHHFDGYPAGLGTALFELYNGHFHGDAAAMLRTLIDEHPAGWSNILGADWTQEPGYIDRNETACAQCGKRAWEHYRQYYLGKGQTPPPGTEIMVLGHHTVRDDGPERPECYCHGARAEEEMLLTSDGDHAGAEWLYVVNVTTCTVEVLEEVYAEGSTDWVSIGTFNLDDGAPNWTRVSRTAA